MLAKRVTDRVLPLVAMILEGIKCLSVGVFDIGLMALLGDGAPAREECGLSTACRGYKNVEASVTVNTIIFNCGPERSGGPIAAFS